MLYLTKADLASHIYVENIDEITRNSDDLVTDAIDSAIAKAKGYLSRFDRTKLFDGTVVDVNLKRVIKDMAAFNLITLANVSLNYDVLKDLNEDAISWLKDVQSGKSDPEGWIYKEDDADTDYPEGSTVSMKSNTKRSNHY